MSELYAKEVQRIKFLITLLNAARDRYYNGAPIMEDRVYDRYFDELERLEAKTGLILSGSPTQEVGFEVKSGLETIVHEYPPMLSLAKSKDITKIHQFLANSRSLVMAKMDGLTCRLTYEDGRLIRAETRGDGEIGEDITHNVKAIAGIPLIISSKDKALIDGELIIKLSDFERLQATCLDENGKRYANARNLASGSARLYDSAQCRGRCLNFIAWKHANAPLSLSNFSTSLAWLKDLGFTVVPYKQIPENASSDTLVELAKTIANEAKELDYKIDGCVFSYESLEKMQAIGYTSHHWKAQIAYKFEDDEYATTIRDIVWTIGKTGAITPTAVFDPVVIDGTTVTRASLHNLTIMKALNVRKNCTAYAFKANMIIPQIASTLDNGEADFTIPEHCPICGGATTIRRNDDTDILICTNPRCSGQTLSKFKTFVSKSAFDIDGLGDKNLELFLDYNLLNDFTDIFKLKQHREFLLTLDGFGEASIDNMLAAIETSKEISLDKFITSLSIPGIGLTTAKAISKHFGGSAEAFMSAISLSFDWTAVEGIGTKTSDTLCEWLVSHYELISDLLDIVIIKNNEYATSTSEIAGKTFCITGTFGESRSALQAQLEALGGIAVSSVSKKTDILFVGENAGSKLKKAQDLNILIYDEAKLNEILRGE